MRNGTKNKLTALLVGALILGPSLAAAEGEMTSSMNALEARMMALEDKLAASEATITAQRAMLGARVAPAPGALDSFLQDLEFGGHVSASYVYNFNNPDQNVGNAGATDGGTQPNYTFNTDHNTFSLDAVKLEIGKPASDPGSAGFQFDLLYGENARILTHSLVQAGATNDRGSTSRDDSLEVFVQQAYVSYNASGIELKLGKFETLLGAEVLDSPENPNITHGHLFQYAIPLWHTGLLASGDLGEGMSWSFGVVNGFNNDIDNNDNKGLLGQLALEQEGYSLTYSSYIGSDGARLSIGPDGGTTFACGSAGTETACVGDDNNRAQIHDLVARFEPSEELSFWSEFVYGRAETDNRLTSHGPLTLSAGDEDPEWWGVSAGFQYALSEKATIAVRGEWLRDDGGLLTGSIDPVFGGPSDEVDLTSATITLGYKVTDNLLARLEYRRDTVDADRGDISPFGQSNQGIVPGFGIGGAAGNLQEDTQDVGLFEVSYIFD